MNIALPTSKTVSLRTMKLLSGQLTSDMDYIKWFAEACGKQIAEAVGALDSMVDEGAFGQDGMSVARLNRARLSFAVHCLEESSKQFVAKPEIARIFDSVLSGKKSDIARGKGHFSRLKEWFGVDEKS